MRLHNPNCFPLDYLDCLNPKTSQTLPDYEIDCVKMVKKIIILIIVFEDKDNAINGDNNDDTDD